MVTVPGAGNIPIATWHVPNEEQSLTRAIDDEGPTLLGPTSKSAGDALRSIINHPHLSNEESNILGQQIQAGKVAARCLLTSPSDMALDGRAHLSGVVEHGLKARRVVASRHLQLVVGLANDFAYNNWRFDRDRRDEMIGVGNLALMKSLEGYIHLPGRHITPFLHRSVLNEMLTEVAKITRHNTGLSVKMRSALRDVNTAYKAAVVAGEAITYIEAAERVGVSEERLGTMLKLRASVTERLDSALNPEDDSLTLLDRVEDVYTSDAIQAIEDQLNIDRIWLTARGLRRRQLLTEREWAVLVCRFEADFTQDEVADALGYEQTTISVVERQALEKVRREIENPGSLDKKSGKEFRIVETATDLLEIMNVGTGSDIDIVGTAAFILDHADITALQRLTMHALLGTDRDGEPRRPHEVAKWRGVTYRAIYDAREKAIKRILAEREKSKV